MLLASNRSIARSLKRGDRKNVNLGNIFNLVYINTNLNHPNCSLLFYSISLSLPAESMKKSILFCTINRKTILCPSLPWNFPSLNIAQFSRTPKTLNSGKEKSISKKCYRSNSALKMESSPINLNVTPPPLFCIATAWLFRNPNCTSGLRSKLKPCLMWTMSRVN